VELSEVTPEEVESVMVPTLAYVEDELKKRPDRLIVCGSGAAEALWPRGLGLGVEPLGSRLGAPGEFNAGLYGYLARLEVA
jgi:hypothetical protein